MSEKPKDELMTDRYIETWLSGLASTTKKNYLGYWEEWQSFIGMTPEGQIKKRMHDVVSEDLTERNYFENQWRRYKEYLEKKGTYRHESVRSFLKTVCSFFHRNGKTLALELNTGDWVSTQEQKIIQKFKLKLEDAKALYNHCGTLRDRSLFLTLLQSGISEVDATELRIEDFPELYTSGETEHLFFEKGREKSTHIQATCLSFETIHDIKAMLEERGKPTKGYLFVSQTKGKGEKIDTRTINEAMKRVPEKTFGTEKAKEFKTKALRSLYNSALLRANIEPQELKDLLMGHERKGARANYDYDDVTIKEAYAKAFEFLSINHGTQERQDLVKLKDTFKDEVVKLSQVIAQQQAEIQRLTALVSENQKETKELVSGLNERLTYYEKHGKKKPAFERFR